MPFRSGDPFNPAKFRTCKKGIKCFERARATAPFSPNRRVAILRAIEGGKTITEACMNAGVNDTTAPHRWKKQADPLESRRGGRKRKLGDDSRKLLYRLATKNPFASALELVEMLEEAGGQRVSKATINRELHSRAEHPFTLKKPDSLCEDRNLERIYDMQLGFKGKSENFKRIGMQFS